MKAETEVGLPGLPALRTASAAKEMRIMVATTTDTAGPDIPQASMLIALRLNEALFIGDMM